MPGPIFAAAAVPVIPETIALPVIQVLAVIAIAMWVLAWVLAARNRRSARSAVGPRDVAVLLGRANITVSEDSISELLTGNAVAVPFDGETVIVTVDRNVNGLTLRLHREAPAPIGIALRTTASEPGSRSHRA